MKSLLCVLKATVGGASKALWSCCYWGLWHQGDSTYLTPLTIERLLELDHIFIRGGEATLHSCYYEAIYDKEAKAIIPPEQRAVLHKAACMESRNQNIKRMRKLGLEKWKRKSGYHRRSLVQTTFYRLKKIFSDRLRSKRTDSQDAEMMIRCAALNRMTSLGMPDSYAT
jgi:hypothetical protein